MELEFLIYVIAGVIFLVGVLIEISYKGQKLVGKVLLFLGGIVIMILLLKVIAEYILNL
jgi:hypothetical protein